MSNVVNSGRYKILGALLGGIVLTSAAAWLPLLQKELEAYNIPYVSATTATYGLFFLIAFVVSYLFVTELIKARIQTQRCNDVLNPSASFELHDKQLFHSMGKKQILMAKRNEWPVSMIALFIQAMKGPKPAPEDVSKKLKEIVVEELEAMMRGSDLAGSFAKNEYLLLFPNCPSEQVKDIAERILKHLSEKRIPIDGEEYRLECKCGIASFEPSALDFKRLMERAFEALDRIKGKRGDRIEIY
ncbi:diguanylate cyclase [Hydrogenimonas sp.]|uniref:GGDEF domain-containing protein n=1 Tax=Hydrogenimonas sp. TaxID=2231112 RepID=UPI00261D57E6|nr:diguanylate cyclase [Hydrogenimonas sp.]